MAIVSREVNGLSGIAIILVLLYNIWPEIFPNCFLAIDLMFIICGYRSTAAMSHPSISTGHVAGFYAEKAKRLFPVYYLMVPIILIVANIFIGISWIETTGKQGLYSLALIKNMETVLNKEDDITSIQPDGQGKDAFRHLWAVAVEAQFCIIAPFIFIILEKLRKKGLQLFFLCLVCSVSWGFFYTSDSKVAFNLLPTRLWQFGLGIIAFIIASKPRSQTIGSITYVSGLVYFISVSFIVFAFFAIFIMIGVREITEIVMRPLASLACFILLIVQIPATKKFLSNKIFTYLGDISYTLYVINWPVMLLFGSRLSPQIVIGSTVILSAVCHKYYEKQCRFLSSGKALLLFEFLAILNIAVFLAMLKWPLLRAAINCNYYDKVPEKLRPALADNLQFLSHRKMKPNGLWTPLHPSTQEAGVFEYSKGYGELKIAVLGDALGMNEVNLIHEEFNGNYFEFKAVLGPELTGFYSNLSGISSDRKILYVAAVDVIEEFQPDVLFLVFQMPREKNAENLKSLSQIINENVEKLERSCGQILIHGLLNSPPRGELSMYIEAFSLGKDLTKFNLNKTIVDEQNINRQRLLEAINCGKCEVYDIRKVFLEGKHYLTYDNLTTVSYFDNFGYLTLAGLDKIRSIYFEIISNVLL